MKQKDKDMTIAEAKQIIRRENRKNKIIDNIAVIILVICIIGLVVIYYY
jgi:hypothetical protein